MKTLNKLRAVKFVLDMWPFLSVSLPGEELPAHVAQHLPQALQVSSPRCNGSSFKAHWRWGAEVQLCWHEERAWWTHGWDEHRQGRDEDPHLQHAHRDRTLTGKGDREEGGVVFSWSVDEEVFDSHINSALYAMIAAVDQADGVTIKAEDADQGEG